MNFKRVFHVYTIHFGVAVFLETSIYIYIYIYLGIGIMDPPLGCSHVVQETDHTSGEKLISRDCFG